jgi:hypothetical protein
MISISSLLRFYGSSENIDAKHPFPLKITVLTSNLTAFSKTLLLNIRNTG